MPDQPTPPFDVPPVVWEAYEALGPWARADAGTWHLLYLVDAIMRPIQEIEDVVRDTDTHVGWGKLLDINAAPSYALPWLAQFMGVTPLKGLDDASQRLRIKEAAGFARGSVGAIRAAAQQFLTGKKTVEIYERDGGNPWRLRVLTYEAETPNPTAVRNAIFELKPAGLVLVHEVQRGLKIDQVTSTIDTTTGTIDSFSSAVPT